MRDVTHAAGLDRLTGLLDRYGLLDQLAATHISAFSALLIVKLDILQFHDVNNGFGYDVGDALLRSVAARLATLPALATSRVDSNTFVLAFHLDDLSLAESIVDSALELMRPRFVLPGVFLAVHFATGYSAKTLEAVRYVKAIARLVRDAP